MDVSIIIPVFNAKKYLDRCLESVLVALEGVSGEVLVVDNGSTDGSLVVARRWQKKCPGAMHVLQCHTPGAAAARNYGFEQAKGEYVWFIDGDDYIAPEAVRKLLARAGDERRNEGPTKDSGARRSQGVDLVMTGAKRLARDGSTSYLSAVDSERPDWRSRFVRYGMGPWQVMVRREWWAEQGLAFPEGIIHEDMALMSALILYTDRLASVDEPLYFYCDNPESVLHKSKFNPQIFDIFPALEGLYQRFEEAGATQKYHAELEWFFVWNLLIDSAKDFGKFPEGRPGYGRARQMLRDYFPAWRKNRFLREKSLKLRIKVRTNYVGLPSFLGRPPKSKK